MSAVLDRVTLLLPGSRVLCGYCIYPVKVSKKARKRRRSCPRCGAVSCFLRVDLETWRQMRRSRAEDLVRRRRMLRDGWQREIRQLMQAPRRVR